MLGTMRRCSGLTGDAVEIWYLAKTDGRFASNCNTNHLLACKNVPACRRTWVPKVRGKWFYHSLDCPHITRKRRTSKRSPCRGLVIEHRLGGPAQKCVQIPTWGRLISPRGEKGRPLTGVCLRPSHAKQLQALLTMGPNIPYHQPIYEAYDLSTGIVCFVLLIESRAESNLWYSLSHLFVLLLPYFQVWRRA